MKKIVLITGGFDPIHSGHISYIQAAKNLGDLLIVGVNSDQWLTQKKGRHFMPLIERANILRSIKGVDFVIDFEDKDNTAKHAIWMVRQSYPQDHIVFANGGDRTASNIPEMDIVDDNLSFVFGVGGEDKKNSSSWILEEWKAPKTHRQWGHWRVLYDIQGCKVKELTVLPERSLSMQRHASRNEHWIVAEGQCVVNQKMSSGYILPGKVLKCHDTFIIQKNEWHQLYNPFDAPCKIVEIQYGEKCEEEDIERS